VCALSTKHSSEANEVINSLPHLEKIKTSLKTVHDTDFDCSLSTLDEFVFDALESGHCKTYQANIAIQVFQPKTIR
jgi:hypothetical protein